MQHEKTTNEKKLIFVPLPRCDVVKIKYFCIQFCLLINYIVVKNRRRERERGKEKDGFGIHELENKEANRLSGA